MLEEASGAAFSVSDTNQCGRRDNWPRGEHGCCPGAFPLEEPSNLDATRQSTLLRISWELALVGLMSINLSIVLTGRRH